MNKMNYKKEYSVILISIISLVFVILFINNRFISFFLGLICGCGIGMPVSMIITDKNIKKLLKKK